MTALRYEGEGSPKVVATGEGHVAERILAAARGRGVPVREDPDAGRGAGRAGARRRRCPEELWLAVAEVLAWAYGLEKEAITPNR